MHIANLRKVGGSVMLTVPPAILELLRLEVGAAVELSIQGNHLIVDPVAKPHYSLNELLAASDYTQVRPPSEQEWVDAPAAGGELI